MAQYKKKVGDNPNQNGHTSGKFLHMCYNQFVTNISGIIVYVLVWKHACKTVWIILHCIL